MGSSKRADQGTNVSPSWRRAFCSNRNRAGYRRLSCRKPCRRTAFPDRTAGRDRANRQRRSLRDERTCNPRNKPRARELLTIAFPRALFSVRAFCALGEEAPPYAARVLLFPDRATFAFLADFVATNPVSVGAAAAASLPELSTEVMIISR